MARNYKFMCSDPGQDLIQQDIRDGLVNRVVVASCSPLMHEATFRRATAAGGISPFYSQMASIREHVSWVTADKGDATDKAKALVAGAVHRVALHEHLDRRQASIHPDVLVVGGGIAGIHAALTLAEAGKHVYLVEREPSIGGQMAKFDKTFPTLDCAACILTPKMVQVGQHPNIDILSYSEVTGVSGYVGNFTRQRAPQGPLHRREPVHRLRPVRRKLQLGRGPLGVRPRPDHPPGRVQALPAGRAEPAGHRPGRHVAVHVRLPGRRRAARVRLAHPQGRIREGVRAGARLDAAGRQPRAGLLRAVRARVHPGTASKGRCRSAGSSASSPTGTTSRATAQPCRHPPRTASGWR